MTTETMREAVEMAILEAAGGMEHGKPANISVLADAAIRTVLERLREPSEAMLAAAVPEPVWLYEGSSKADRASLQAATMLDRMVAMQKWQAMLDAAAREVG